MKKKFFPLIASFILFQFFQCKKDTTAPVDFSQFTTTDTLCNLTGETDNTDWTNDVSWNTTETTLMSFNPNVADTDSIAGFVQISPPCPNPSNGFFVLRLNTERQCIMKIACVNTSYETLFYSAKILAGGAAADTFDFRSFTAFHKNENYRMYYAFYTAADSLYYKGHGDFRIE